MNRILFIIFIASILIANISCTSHKKNEQYEIAVFQIVEYELIANMRSSYTDEINKYKVYSRFDFDEAGGTAFSQVGSSTPAHIRLVQGQEDF